MQQRLHISPRHHSGKNQARAGWVLLLVVVIIAACLAQRSGFVHFGCSQGKIAADQIVTTDKLPENKDCQASEQLLRQNQSATDFDTSPFLIKVMVALLILHALLVNKPFIRYLRIFWPETRLRLHLRLCKFQE
ncbi:MAG: hypothetical protein JKY50_08495 [Oleispira sp.]|nr:hypothetical protein [Oleispira sp.]MBL4881392.1 hypothetical protein [Oleispira sp.]